MFTVKRAFGTFLLVFLVLAAFVLEMTTGRVGSESALLAMGALPNSGELGRQYWRLVAYSFLHLNWMHLLLNVGIISWTGQIVERRLGAVRALETYGAAALAGGLAIWIARMADPKPGASLGASAGAFGLQIGRAHV